MSVIPRRKWCPHKLRRDSKSPRCTKNATRSKFTTRSIFFGTAGSFGQKFRKGVGGQRGLARRNPSKTRDLGLFSVPFFLCPLRNMGTHFWRTFWALFGGLFVANPIPPTPFRNRCPLGRRDESPLVYPYPKNTRNSDHGLSFPSPETQTMV